MRAIALVVGTGISKTSNNTFGAKGGMVAEILRRALTRSIYWYSCETPLPIFWIRHWAYCCYCLLYGTKFLGRKWTLRLHFQSIGYCYWKNANVSGWGFKVHDSSEAQKMLLKKALAFKEVASMKYKCIQSCLSGTYESLVERNRAMLSIIDVVLVLGQRNVTFWGHDWNRDFKQGMATSIIFYTKKLLLILCLKIASQALWYEMSSCWSLSLTAHLRCWQGGWLGDIW